MNVTDWAALAGVAAVIYTMLLWAAHHEGGRRAGYWRQEALRYRAERDALAWRLRTRPRPLTESRPRPSQPGGARPPMPRRKPRRTPPMLPLDDLHWEAPTTELRAIATGQLPAIAPRVNAQPELEAAAR